MLTALPSPIPVRTSTRNHNPTAGAADRMRRALVVENLDLLAFSTSWQERGRRPAALAGDGHFLGRWQRMSAREVWSWRPPRDSWKVKSK